MIRSRYAIAGTVRAIAMSCALLVGGGAAVSWASEFTPGTNPVTNLETASGDWWPASDNNDALANYLRQAPPTLRAAASSYALGDWWPAQSAPPYAETPTNPASVADAVTRTHDGK